MRSVLHGFLPKDQEFDVKKEHGKLVVRGLFASVADTLKLVVSVGNNQGEQVHHYKEQNHDFECLCDV